ncbi:endonuclease/exonuclease/phosphatase family protein [Candidatus Saccharibacteria bacterium]|nr:endonuclease/exonuclease/phosphatase family protein [Candidatus Saccharibacteria bacterium]
MKILQINAWCGRIKDGLTTYIKKENPDIICMQEAVWCDDSRADNYVRRNADTVNKIMEECGYNYASFAPNWGLEMFGGEFVIQNGIAIISRIPIVEEEKKLIYSEYNVRNSLDSIIEPAGEHGYYAQKVVLENGLVVVNYHGYWQKDPMGNETSVECMRKVAEMFRDEERPVVMCGDLNLTYAAPAMRELDFMTDMTAENGVKTTLRNLRFEAEVDCDHILLNSRVKGSNYQLHDEPVSDHLMVTADLEII